MPYGTDEKLKSYLDTNQLHREQMCRAILSIDKRFTDVRPRHPRGGRDGGRDIEAIYKENQRTYGAVGFVNQANDSQEQKKSIKSKFRSDLKSAINADISPEVFIFFTNINLTIKEKDDLIKKSIEKGISFCDIFDRERLRIVLDSPDGFSIRFQYLGIPLSEEEQATFFARWGDDIQSVISTGFQRIENTLNRVLFLQEASSVMTGLAMYIELDKKYQAEEIGHFRLFCDMTLKEPRHKILSILFGAFDKSSRVKIYTNSSLTEQKSGIKYSIGGGQWERHISLDRTEEYKKDLKYECVGSSSSIGMDPVEFIPISYNKHCLIRFFPCLSLCDIDEAMFMPILNKSLAEKVKSIHIFSSGYKLQEIQKAGFYIDTTSFDPKIPVEFTDEELNDPWVRIRPKNASTFHMRFFEETPKRMFVSSQIQNSLEGRRTSSA